MLVNSFDKLKSPGSSEETEDVKRDGTGWDGLGWADSGLLSLFSHQSARAAPGGGVMRFHSSLAVIHFTQISRVKASDKKPTQM